MTIVFMDFRNQIRRHPAHRAMLRRMRPRKDFFDSVPPLTDAEEQAFAALQANMAMRLVMQKMQPHLPHEAAGAPHDHLPRFSVRAARAEPVKASRWSPVALCAIGMAAAAGLWAVVYGLVLAF